MDPAIATKKIRRTSDSEVDLISELPECVTDIILTKLPIRDAVKTSLLSSEWRYRWASMTHLVFDDRIVSHRYNKDYSTDDYCKADIEEYIINFIDRAFLLHDGGPIHKLSISSWFLRSSSPHIDRWLRFASRKEVKELFIELGDDGWFEAPSSVFCLNKLIRLELVGCFLELPRNFKGFPCLKHLCLNKVFIALDDVERLVSSCSLLEGLSLSCCGSYKLTIRAPNLKYLNLERKFLDLYLETDSTNEIVRQQRSRNIFRRLLGGVPKLNSPQRSPITYLHLTSIKLSLVRFYDGKEVLKVFQLILNSPNLEELEMSGSRNAIDSTDAPDLNIWDGVLYFGITLQQLKTVKLTDMFGIPHEMKFIKYILEHALVLEQMNISPSYLLKEGKLNMQTELVRFRGASPQVSIKFVQEPE